MNEVYINCKYFRNDDFYEIFRKDLVSVEELVDKLYEFKDIIEEKDEEIEDLKDEIRDKKDEISDLKEFYMSNH